MAYRTLPISEVLAGQLTERGLKRIASQKTQLSASNFEARSLEQMALYFDRKLIEQKQRQKAGGKRMAAAKPKVGYPRRKPSGYWKRVRKEMNILLCTNDVKYKTIRSQLLKQGTATQTFIVSQISLAVGASLGTAAGAIVPLVAICLLGLLQVGKEAYCKGSLNK
jgi:hypothetical protein